MIFSKNYFGVGNKILAMEIVIDMNNRELKLSHENYNGKVLNRFSMEYLKAVSTPLVNHFQLYYEMCPKTFE